MTNTTTTWAARKQGETLVTAEAHRERWTREDVELVAQFTDVDDDVTLAETVGRSLYAIWSIQHRIRHEGVAGVLATFDKPQARVVATCPTHHIALTALGECDWC